MGAFALIREDYRAFSRLRGDGSAVRRQILGEVTIGDNSVVGAGAWVDSDMPGSIAVADKAAIVEGKAEALFGSAGILPY